MMKMTNLSNILLNYASTNKELRVIMARLASDSNNKASELVDIPRRTVDRIVARVAQRAQLAGEEIGVGQPKILILDIETAPMLSYIWSLWKPAFGTAMLEHTTYILSWAAKWHDSDEVFADAICYNEDYAAGDEDDKRMLQNIWNLLDEADFIVAHNGDKFDIKKLNTRFLLNGMTPPSPYKQIDTLKIVKRVFGFDSNRLDHLLKEMYDEGKDDAGGFDTWRGCMAGDMESWEKLISYNKADVTKLERLYMDIRGWDKQHPSAATHGGGTGKTVCTVCGSEDVKPTGKTVSTGVSVFPLFTCQGCGAHMRGRSSLLSPRQKQAVLVKV